MNSITFFPNTLVRLEDFAIDHNEGLIPSVGRKQGESVSNQKGRGERGEGRGERENLPFPYHNLIFLLHYLDNITILHW